MAGKFSKTQVDRLGDRLRKGSPSEDNLRLLDEYRRSFGEAYETVVRTLREELQLEPTGRPAKSTSALIEKLHRESIRLSQVQDIAGCRIVVADIAEQDRVVVSLTEIFSGASVVDRRKKPSYGYRAVHVIVGISEKLIEVQVRTPLQHLWAEYSEKLSDMIDPAIKYGGGIYRIKEMLTRLSVLVAGFEESEKMMTTLKKKQVDESGLRELEKENARVKESIAQLLADEISWLDEQKGQKQWFS